MVEAASAEALRNLSEAFPPEPETAPQRTVSGDKLDVTAYLTKYGCGITKEKRHRNSTLYILEGGCLFDSSHTKGEAAIGQTDEGKLFYHRFHESCKGHTWHEARQIISGDAPLFERSLHQNFDSRQGVDKTVKYGDWDKPLNIFDEYSLGDPKWQRHYCPDVINDFAYDEAERMGVRPEQVAGPAIICAAGVIDDKIKLQPKQIDYTWQESARLWGAVKGDSGAIKSPGKERAVSVLKQIEKELYDSYKQKMMIYQAELSRWESLTKNERKEIDPPKEPKRRRVICNDTTVEAMRDMLSDETLNRKLTCDWDELSGMLGSLDAYRQSKSVSRDRSLYLELWNGGPKPIDRAGKVNIFVPNWSACISGTITDQVMKEYFGKLNADGFLQRFLLYRARRLGPGVDRMPNQEAEEKYYTAIKLLFEFRPEEKIIIKLSDEAQKVREIFEKLIGVAYDLPGNTHAFNAHLNKYRGLFCRLTLVYHLLHCAQEGRLDLTYTVDEKTARMASEALIEYHLPVAREFYKTFGYEDQGESVGQDVAGYILSKKLDEISSRDISRNVRVLRSDVPGIQNAMEFLTLSGWVKPTKEVKGRPTTWAVNPIVHSLYKQQADAERERRETAREKIKEAVNVFMRRAV